MLVFTLAAWEGICDKIGELESAMMEAARAGSATLPYE